VQKKEREVCARDSVTHVGPWHASPLHGTLSSTRVLLPLIIAPTSHDDPGNFTGLSSSTTNEALARYGC
jgi:hypothetical protein